MTISPSQKTAAETDGIRRPAARRRGDRAAGDDTGFRVPRHQLDARSTSSSPRSRCVTARSTAGWIVEESPTPASSSRASASPWVSPSGARSICTKFVSTWSRSTGSPAACQASREPSRAGVIVGEPLDVVIERVDARRRDDPRLAHRAAEEVLFAPGALDHRSAEPASSAPSGQPRPFERQIVTVSKRAAIAAGRHALRDSSVDEARTVEVHGEPHLARRARDRVELVERPDAPARAVVGVLESRRLQAPDRRSSSGRALRRAPARE